MNSDQTDAAHALITLNAPGVGRFELFPFKSALAPSEEAQLGIRKFRVDNCPAV